MGDPVSILKKYWGYDSFRPMQLDIIRSILQGNDTLALLATGGGKSITYQVPALLSEGTCIVISPLIALMQDQMRSLTDRGIKALILSSFMSKKELDIAMDNCIYGDYKFLFISPERLNSHLFMERLKRIKVSFITIDEAHCISQWGHDFRPDYLLISRIREIHSCPILALTATATNTVANDICEHLGFNHSEIIKGGFARPNLVFHVSKSSDKLADLLRLTKGKDEIVIIYTRSRADTEKISGFLNDHGLTTHHYHAGLSQVERTSIQEDWMAEKFKIMVATNAFGMGIDKPNVRTVIHYTLCDNPEAYFQEAGRAGRDKKKANVYLLFNDEDLSTAQYRLEQSHPSHEYVRQIYHHLCMNYQLAIGSGAEDEYQFDLRDFCKKYSLRLFECHAALKSLEMNHHIVLNDGFHHTSKLRLIVDRHAVEHFIATQSNLGALLSTVLRSYTHLFSQEVKIRETELCRRTGLTYFEVKNKLAAIESMGILEYTPSHDQSMIRFVNPRIAKEHLTLNVRHMKIRKEQAQKKLKAMVNYVLNRNICRPVMLLHYFNETQEQNCGICDNCTRSSTIPYNTLAQFRKVFLEKLNEQPLSVDEVLRTENGLDKEALKNALRWLIDEGSVEIIQGMLTKIN